MNEYTPQQHNYSLLKFQGMGQRKMTSFHVLDALFLFGKDVRNLHFNERYSASYISIRSRNVLVS